MNYVPYSVHMDISLAWRTKRIKLVTVEWMRQLSWEFLSVFVTKVVSFLSFKKGRETQFSKQCCKPEPVCYMHLAKQHIISFKTE